MPKNKIDKTSIKKQQWSSRTSTALHASEETTTKLLELKRSQGLRINTLKIDINQAIAKLKALGWKGEQVEWCREGFTINEGYESIRDSELHAEGYVYIQNPASWLPVIALNAAEGQHILDVCAAPGGKTSHIASLTNNKSIIVANDNSRVRLSRLKSNLERLAVKNFELTLYDADRIASKYNGKKFDRILIDAPCSGEGMMSLLTDKDFGSWSVAHIKRLQRLQKRILSQSWQLLKPGGVLVYSTCTMAPEENEAVVDYLLKHNSDAFVQQLKIDISNKVPAVLSWNGKQFNKQLQFATRLIPSKEAEAFFVCMLFKQP